MLLSYVLNIVVISEAINWEEVPQVVPGNKNTVIVEMTFASR